MLRFGILGTGNIAAQFAAGAATARRATVTAVASRSADAAAAFAAAHRIPNATTYDGLLAEAAVDAVYVSLPNALHHRWTLAALAAGKHVLCEKPIALDGAQAAEMFDAADRAGRVLVEAFMYRAHPLTAAVHRAATDGTIGRVRLVRASFCYRTTKVAGNVRFDRRLGGGCLMDVGCYCVSFARLMAGAEPTAVSAAATFHESGVDDGLVATLSFPGDVLATVACGMGVQADNAAHVCGTDGYVEVPVPWKPPEAATFVVARGTPPKMDGRPPGAVPPPQVVTVPAGSSLYGIEADAFAAAVAGEVPPFVTRADSLGNMAVLDAMRRQVGLSFD